MLKDQLIKEVKTGTIRGVWKIAEQMGDTIMRQSTAWENIKPLPKKKCFTERQCFQLFRISGKFANETLQVVIRLPEYALTAQLRPNKFGEIIVAGLNVVYYDRKDALGRPQIICAGPAVAKEQDGPLYDIMMEVVEKLSIPFKL